MDLSAERGAVLLSAQLAQRTTTARTKGEAAEHASPTPVRIPDQLCGRDFWPVFAGMAVTDHGESTLNVSPGRVTAPLIALVRRELLRCNYRRSDKIRPSCQQRSGRELDASTAAAKNLERAPEVDARLHSRCGRRMSRRNEAEDSATWQIRARP